MSYRFFLERYEWMNEKKANKRNDHISEKEEEVVRRIYFKDPSKKRERGRAEFQIVMRNFDSDRIHLEERYSENGKVYSKTVWLMKEDCERILKNDLDWMARRESVIFDLYYHIIHEGYRMAMMDERTEQILKDDKEGKTIILEKNRRQILPAAGQFFEKNPEWEHDIRQGKCRVIEQKECTFPQVALDMICMPE